MQLELVLNDDEKKERFKASLAKKRESEEILDGLTTPQTSFEEDNLSESIAKRVVELMYLRSTLANFSQPMSNSLSSTLASCFQTPTSSSYNRPTGRVDPMPKQPKPCSLSDGPEVTPSSFFSSFKKN